MSEPTTTAVPAPAGVSRRRLLGAFPAVAAMGVSAAVVGGALDAAPAAAGVGSPMILGEGNDGGNATTSLTSTNTEAVFQVISPDVRLTTDISGGFIALTDNDGTDGGLSFELTADSGHGTASAYINGTDAMLQVQGFTHGASDGSYGSTAFSAVSTGAPAVQARVTSGFDGPTEVPSTAVDAASGLNGVGVKAASESGPALVAANTDTATFTDAVNIQTAGLGRAVLGVATHPRNQRAAVTGVNHGLGAGLQGIQIHPHAIGPAVIGEAGAKGRGAEFSGGAAAVRMLAGPGKTHPPSGLLGDFYVDAATRLWFCKGGTSWHQLA